jgi:cob(I)alamin adenosyltransferase
MRSPEETKVSSQKLALGMVHVYTGHGKGKTTAALGLALRAIGHGFKVCMIQFMKGDPEYGELRAARHLPGFIVRQFGHRGHVNRQNPSEEDVLLARQALAYARKIITSGEYELVILDEINVALDFKLVDLQEVLAIVRDKPARTELVLTGRDAPGALIQAADLVTEMREIKHYFQRGRKARDGIEH